MPCNCAVCYRPREQNGESFDNFTGFNRSKVVFSTDLYLGWAFIVSSSVIGSVLALCIYYFNGMIFHNFIITFSIGTPFRY